MIYLKEDAPSVQSATGVIDIPSGFAIDVPLGMQAPRAVFEQDPSIIERIAALREAHGVSVPDDMLEPRHDVEVAPEGTKRTANRKRKPRARAGRSKLAQKNKEGLGMKTGGILTARERATYIEWKSFRTDSGMETKTPGVFPAQLRRYWLGEGLARWATTTTPYRSLVAALRKEGVPGHMIHGLAARLYHWHFGVWPGKKNKKDWDELRLLLFKFADYEMETK